MILASCSGAIKIEKKRYKFMGRTFFVSTVVVHTSYYSIIYTTNNYSNF